MSAVARRLVQLPGGPKRAKRGAHLVFFEGGKPDSFDDFGCAWSAAKSIEIFGFPPLKLCKMGSAFG